MKIGLLFAVIIISLHTFAQMGGQPVVLVSGKVRNERNMKPVGAKIIYETLPSGTEAGIARSAPGDGQYKIILPRGKKYGYYALAEGYYSVTKYFDVTELDHYMEMDGENLYLAPVEVDQVVRLNNIFFKENSSDFTKESLPELERFIMFLKTNKKIEIEIASHTDNSLSSDLSKEISQKRADAVMNYITSNGVSKKRITAIGFGQEQPIGFNNTEEGKEMNNRIEFKVTSLEKTK